MRSAVQNCSSGASPPTGPPTMTANGAACPASYRMLTAAALQASAYPAVRSRIVPAATRLPTVFTALVNRLAE